MEMSSSPELHIVQTGGASLLRGCMLFSADSRYLICSCGNEIKVFSAASGKCVHRLIGHEDRVTGVSQHPKLTLQVISSSLDLTIRVWDYDDGILMRTVQTDFPIHCIYSHPSFSEHVYVAELKDDQYCISRIKTKDLQFARDTELKSSRNFEAVLDGVKKPLTKSLGFLSSHTHIAICKEKSLCIVNTDHLHLRTEHKNDGSGQITCIGCHPSDNCCITGHISGQIKFWHNVYPSQNMSKKGSRNSNTAIVTSMQHWHKERVDDVCFTPGGSSAMSVGKEGVLVQWHLIESGNRMNFFPRLGAPMRRVIVSNDGTLYATLHIDNSILVLSNLFIVKHTIEGFTSSAHYLRSKTQDSKELDTSLYNMEYDWKTQSCVCNGKPGHLLFYQPYADSQLYNLDITHRNYIGPSLNDTVITKVAFSPGFQEISHIQADSFESNTWMATIEELDNRATMREHKLKIWVFDETKQWWKLNTVINEPHDSHVTRLVFRPFSDASSYPALLTTSLDGAAKLWMPAKNKRQEGIFWSCQAVTSYRNCAAFDADFSNDGSLAALAFEHTVCLCNPDMLEDVTVFLDLTGKDQINQILFGSHRCEHILMVLTGSCMRSCDLLSGGILWSVDLETSRLVRDPLSNVMAVFTTDGDLHTFRPDQPLPLYTHMSASQHRVLGAIFIPYMREKKSSWISDDCNVEWMRRSRLFFVTSEMTVHVICTGEEKSNRKSSPNHTKVSSKDECLVTPLVSVLSSSSTRTQQASDNAVSSLPHTAVRNALEQITDASSHVMPPVSMLCQTFLSSLMLKRSVLKADKDSRTLKAQYRYEEGEEDIMLDKCDVPVSCLSSINTDSFVYVSEAFKE